MKTECSPISEINFDESSFLLENPNRGLRGETYITLGKHLRAYPGENEDPFERAEALKKNTARTHRVYFRSMFICVIIQTDRLIRLRLSSWKNFSAFSRVIPYEFSCVLPMQPNRSRTHLTRL